MPGKLETQEMCVFNWLVRVVMVLNEQRIAIFPTKWRANEQLVGCWAPGRCSCFCVFYMIAEFSLEIDILYINVSFGYVFLGKTLGGFVFSQSNPGPPPQPDLLGARWWKLKSPSQVHFVDGSAFSLYGRPSSDPSVPLEKAGVGWGLGWGWIQPYGLLLLGGRVLPGLVSVVSNHGDRWNVP